MTQYFISHEANHTEAWICVCGNTPSSDGFFPCDANGNEVEPTLASGWSGIYICARCGRIINQDTLEVVGFNPHPKMLS
jgi:hypothetical protein